MLTTVHNAQFYHVSRGGNWQEEALYFVGDKHNYFYQRLMNQSFPTTDGEQNQAAQIRFYQFWMQEMLIEKIRTEQFSNRPSRFKAMWVIPNQKEAMTFWLPKLKAPNAKIMKLELNGQLHRSPQNLIQTQAGSANAKERNAYAYWLGNNGQERFDDECIFQGFIRVMEIIDGPPN